MKGLREVGRFAVIFRRFENRNIYAGCRRAWRDGFVVLDIAMDSLQEQRSTASAGLDVLRESELAFSIGLDAAQVLRAFLRSLEECYRRARLWFAGGAVRDHSIDGGMSNRRE